jgi:3-phenylpropionate/trans-cinnamate dioxygenase ferredoxin subunit
MSVARLVTVARAGEVPEGGVKVVYVDGVALAVYHVGGEYFVTDDVCTHDGGPLAEGMLEDHVIECPRHGARFDIRTGAVLALPAVSPVPTYRVHVNGDDIQVEWT